MAAAGALGGEAAAAVGAELPVGGRLRLADLTLLHEAVQRLQMLPEALLDGLLRWLLGFTWLGHFTYRAGPAASGCRTMPDPIVDNGERCANRGRCRVVARDDKTKAPTRLR